MKWEKQDKDWWIGYSGEIDCFAIVKEGTKEFCLGNKLPGRSIWAGRYSTLTQAKSKARGLFLSWLNSANLTTGRDKYLVFFETIDWLLKEKSMSNAELLQAIKKECKKI